MFLYLEEGRRLGMFQKLLQVSAPLLDPFTWFHSLKPCILAFKGIKIASTQWEVP